MQSTTVQISGAYAGGVKIRVYTNNKTYIIEVEGLVKMLEKQIEEKGFTESLKPRQQFPRLIINQ